MQRDEVRAAVLQVGNLVQVVILAAEHAATAGGRPARVVPTRSPAAGLVLARSIDARAALDDNADRLAAINVQLRHAQIGRDLVEQSLLARALLSRIDTDIRLSLGPPAPTSSDISERGPLGMCRSRCDHEAGITQGLLCSDHGQLHVAVHVPRLLGVDVPGDVKVLDLTGDLHGIG